MVLGEVVAKEAGAIRDLEELLALYPWPVVNRTGATETDVRNWTVVRISMNSVSSIASAQRAAIAASTSAFRLGR
jgi:hypothetical protein